jgi:hypothetical protein
MKFLSLENKRFVWIIFSLLFIYLVVRAIFIKPYCDEASTLIDYVESPLLIEQIIRDTSAIYHLLNTLLGNFMYLFFGDIITFLRIPNVLSFILYFFSIKYIVLKCILPKYQIVTFVALNTVAWIFEYFAYLRGYGLALGLLFCAITLFYSWIQNKVIYKYILFLTFLWLSLFANLSFFNTSILLWFLGIVYFLVNAKEFKNQHIIFYSILNIGYLIALIPLISYSFELKEAGALWWGSLVGIWDCTGFSLTSLTLFAHNDFLKYSIILLIILIFVLGLIKLKKVGFKQFISTFEGIFFTLFIGNIFMIEILAVFFKVNYPQDRAAVQLVLFLIITFILFFQKIKYFNYLAYLLLFFPISFIFKIDVNSSIYQTDHRLSKSISHYLHKNLDNESSYSFFGLLHNPAILELRKEKNMRLFNHEKYYKFVESSYLILPTAYTPPPFYKLKMTDEITQISIFENVKQLKYKLVKDTIIKFYDGTNDILLFRQNEIDTLFKTNKFKVKISSEMEFSSYALPLHLVLTLGDSLDPNRYYYDNCIEKLATTKKDINIVWNSPVYTLENDKKNLAIYFWNIEHKRIIYKNTRFKIYNVVENEVNLK